MLLKIFNIEHIFWCQSGGIECTSETKFKVIRKGKKGNFNKNHVKTELNQKQTDQQQLYFACAANKNQIVTKNQRVK